VVRRTVEVRREEILDAAVAEVARTGFARVRVVDVAKALGCSSALVFYHFETKDQLLARAFEHAVEGDLARLTAVTSSGHDATDRLARVLRLYLPRGSAPGWTLQVDAWAEALRTPALRTSVRRLEKQWRAAVAQVLADGVAEGTFGCTDPETAAQRLTAYLDGLCVQATVYSAIGRHQLGDWARSAAALVVGINADALR
jgi:AcrR family transcriptional regulator